MLFSSLSSFPFFLVIQFPIFSRYLVSHFSSLSSFPFFLVIQFPIFLRYLVSQFSSLSSFPFFLVIQFPIFLRYLVSNFSSLSSFSFFLVIQFPIFPRYLVSNFSSLSSFPFFFVIQFPNFPRYLVSHFSSLSSFQFHIFLDSQDTLTTNYSLNGGFTACLSLRWITLITTQLALEITIRFCNTLHAFIIPGLLLIELVWVELLDSRLQCSILTNKFAWTLKLCVNAQK